MNDVWLLLPDALTIRLFFESGIVDGLEERLEERLVTVLPSPEAGADWAPRVRGTVLYRTDLAPFGSTHASALRAASTERSTASSATTRSRCA